MYAAEAQRGAYGDDPITRCLFRGILLGVGWLFLGGALDFALSAAGLGSLAHVASELLTSLWRGLTLQAPDMFFWLVFFPWAFGLLIAVLIDLGLVPEQWLAPSRRALMQEIEALFERVAVAEAAAARAARGFFERVQVKELRLCDEAGRLRAVLGRGAEGTLLGLVDEQGSLRIELHVDTDGAPELVLYDGAERARIALAVKDDEPVVIVRHTMPAPGAESEPGPPGYL